MDVLFYFDGMNKPNRPIEDLEMKKIRIYSHLVDIIENTQYYNSQQGDNHRRS